MSRFEEFYHPAFDRQVFRRAVSLRRAAFQRQTARLVFEYRSMNIGLATDRGVFPSRLAPRSTALQRTVSEPILAACLSAYALERDRARPCGERILWARCSVSRWLPLLSGTA